MASIIDELVLKLSLDNSSFQRASQQAQEATRKVSREHQDQAKVMEAAGQRVADGFRKIRNEAVALFALFLGANGLRQFVRDTTAAEVATGNLAANIGMSVEQLDAWGKASERLGGNAEATKQSLLGIGQAVQRLISMGEQSQTTNILSQLGINMVDAQGRARNPADILKDLSRAVQNMPRPQAYSILSSMGLDPGTINLVLEGTEKLNSDLEDAFRVAMSFKDAKVGQDLYRQFVTLSQEVGKFARDLLTDLAPALTAVMKAMNDWLKLNGEWLRQQIEQKVAEFARWIMSIDWNGVIQNIKSFITEVSHVIDALGGWLRIAEIIFGIWFGSKILQAAANVATLTRALSTGLLPLMLRLGPLLALLGTGAAGGEDPEFSKEKNDEYLRNHPGGEGGVSGWLRRNLPNWMTGANLHPSVDKEKAAKESYDFWISKGYSPAAAAGMVAQEDKESGFRGAAAVGDSGQAHGAFQWHDDRRRAILAGTGIDVADPRTTHQQQLEAALWEQTHGGEQKAGGLIRGSGSAAEAGAAGSLYYERPANAQGEAGERARLAEYYARKFGGPDPSLLTGAKPNQIAATTNNNQQTTTNQSSVDTHINGPINIQTSAADPDGIAKGIGASLRKYAIVGQANYGLA